MVKNIYGGQKNLQQLLENETFVHRMLQPVEVFPDSMKPLEKRYSNASKRSKKSKACSKQRYYENLAKDLMDLANASKRATGCFSQILEAMEDAREGYEYFTRTMRGPPRHHCAMAHSAAHKARANTRRTRGRARRHGSTSTATC